MEVPIEADQPWPPFNMPWGTDDPWDHYCPHCPEGTPCPYEEESTKGGEG